MMTVLSNDDCLAGALLSFFDFFFGGIAAGERGCNIKEQHQGSRKGSPASPLTAVVAVAGNLDAISRSIGMRHTCSEAICNCKVHGPHTQPQHTAMACGSAGLCVGVGYD
mgnify:CR=1 FL=1